MSAGEGIRELEELIGSVDNLPSLPAVALEVLHLTRDENASMEDLAEAVARDPALCAKVLRMANSSLFRRGNEVSTLLEATMRLGLKTLKMMALSFSLAATLPREGRSAFDYIGYWRRSLVMAVSARSLARLVKCSQQDEAFVCGLLAEFGRLALAEAIPDRYKEVQVQAEGPVPTSALERQVLGFDHHRVGALILQSWELPETIWRPIELCGAPHELEEYPPEVRELVGVLDMSRGACLMICEGTAGQGLRALEERGGRYFGLAKSEVEAFFVGLEGGITETALLLNVELPQLDAYGEILERARQQLMQLSIGTVADLNAAAQRASELEKMNAELSSRANTDALTQLPNRARFDAELEAVVRARIAGNGMHRSLGIVMIDVDHFKRFNDEHGHPAGDAVLREVAQAIASSVRGGNLAARYGGEEFVVLLPNVTLENLEPIAERLRSRVADAQIEYEGQTFQVTVSVGGACVEHIRTQKAGALLLSLADECLYEAKHRGRDCCVCREVEI